MTTSLYVLGLPRSLSTFIYQHARQALDLAAPNFTSDGEILNAGRFEDSRVFKPGYFQKFMQQKTSPEAWKDWNLYMDHCYQTHGMAYKDVVQPYFSTAWLKRRIAQYDDVRVLRISRTLADVAYCMMNKGWYYPSQKEISPENMMSALDKAWTEISTLDDMENRVVTVNYEDLIYDETHLNHALHKLYPGSPLKFIAYINSAFCEKRSEARKIRSTLLYKNLTHCQLLEESRNSNKISTHKMDLKPGIHKTNTTKVSRISENSNRIKILVVADGAAPTGFSRVSENIFRRLHKRFEIHHLAVNYYGDPHNLPWKLYPANFCGTPNHHDPFGFSRIAALTKKIKPDLIWLLNDAWNITSYMKQLRTIENLPPVVVYCPIDASPVDENYLRAMAGISRFVTYTDFAEAEVKRSLTSIRERYPHTLFPDIDVIPHGVDCKIFYPLAWKEHTEYEQESFDPAINRQLARQQLFPDKPELHNAFIVLNANRNQPRKRIDLTIEGFAQFAAEKPASVKLYLHMGLIDAGWDILKLCRHYGIEERLILSTADKRLTNLSDEQLNLVYNACDVGVNTADAEGWGLVSFEHAATGAAQIVPSHSGPKSLWGNAADQMEPGFRVCVPGRMNEAYLINPSKLAERLERLYQDTIFKKQRSKDALRHARHQKYSWDNIVLHWEKLFNEVINENNVKYITVEENVCSEPTTV